MLIRTYVVLVILLLPTALEARQRNRPFKSAELTLEYPDNWVQQTNIGTVLVLVSTTRADAAVAIVRERLNQPLDASEMTETFVNIQADVLKEEHADATGLTAVLVTHPTLGPVVQADFTAPGNDSRRPGPDRIRQYALPRGQFLYRIVFRVRAIDFAKQELVFNAILKSLRITPPAPKEGQE
jgi:hypothetical protein